MAPFENVTFEFYTNVLGRNKVPDAKTFDSLKMINEMKITKLINQGLVQEGQKNGIDSTVCLWIEEDYAAEQTASGADNFDTGESIGAYNYSTNTKSYDEFIIKNSKSVDEKKYEWLELFCTVCTGVL